MVVYVIVVLLVALAIAALSVRILKQYERGVQFRLGRVKDGARGPGVIFIIPFVDRVNRVSLRIVTMPIQSQGIITRDNVSVDVSAVAYYRVKDVVRSVVAIENVSAAINQIAQTTLRAVVGRHTLDETLAETDTINQNMRAILDVQTEEWGIEVTVVELKDIQLPESMKRAPRPPDEHDRRARRLPEPRDDRRRRRHRRRRHARGTSRSADDKRRTGRELTATRPPPCPLRPIAIPQLLRAVAAAPPAARCRAHSTTARFQRERWLETEIYAADHGDQRRLAHGDAFARFMSVVDTPQKLPAWRQSARTLAVDAPTPDGQQPVTG